MKLINNQYVNCCNYCRHYHGDDKTKTGYPRCKKKGTHGFYYWPVPFYNSCDFFEYYPIRNQFGIESPSYINEALTAHYLHEKLEEDIRTARAINASFTKMLAESSGFYLDHTQSDTGNF